MCADIWAIVTVQRCPNLPTCGGAGHARPRRVPRRPDLRGHRRGRRGRRRVACAGRAASSTTRTAPLAGLVATFVFAAQMLNFPVGAGTSGHLLGRRARRGAGRARTPGVLCVTRGPARAGLLFADGGITALGTNIDLMGVVTVVVGWLVFRALQAVLPEAARRWSRRSAAVARRRLGAGRRPRASPALYAVGGTRDRPARHACSTAMLGVARADRHRRGRDHRPRRSAASSRSAPTSCTARAGSSPKRALEIRTRPRSAAVQRTATRRPSRADRPRSSPLVLAGVVSYYASASPDGLSGSPPTRASQHRDQATRRRLPARRLRRRGYRRRPALGGSPGVIGAGVLVLARASSGRHGAVRRRSPPSHRADG